MKEDLVEQTVRAHGERFPAFSPVPLRRRRTKWLIAAPGAVLALVVVGALTAPSAGARSYQQVLHALKDVKTMAAETSVKSAASGSLRVAQRAWMADGKLAFDFPLTSRRRTRTLLVGGQLECRFLGLGVATREPCLTDPLLGKDTALSWVMEAWNPGPTPSAPMVRRLAGAPHNGRPTYLLETEHVTDELKGVQRLVVDAQTNLPIRVETLHQSGGKTSYEDKTEFEFERPVPPDVFQPWPSPVVDLPARWRELFSRWKAVAVAEGRFARVVDAQQSADGSLYVLYTGTWRPVAARANGVEYVHAARFDPGGVQGDTGIRQDLRSRGLSLRGVVLVPTTISPAAVTSLSVDFKDAPQDLGAWDRHEPAPASATETLTVPVRPCLDWPDYAFELVISQELLHVDVTRAKVQAEALQSKGDVDGAVAMYREAARRRKENSDVMNSYLQLVPAEALLRRAGRTAEADAIKKEIEAGERARP